MQEYNNTCDEPVEVTVGGHRLGGIFNQPDSAHGIVLFAHGSGSSRFSSRNQYVAGVLQRAGFATLLFDLLDEQESEDRAKVFDIMLLARRLTAVAAWVIEEKSLSTIPLGYFGASTGAGAALVAAADQGSSVAAVVSRGGRPDLAGEALARVVAPTLLIVGGDDEPVIELNRRALAAMHCEKQLTIVPGATHLFPEPGALQTVARLATDWFQSHLARQASSTASRLLHTER